MKVKHLNYHDTMRRLTEVPQGLFWTMDLPEIAKRSFMVPPIIRVVPWRNQGALRLRPKGLSGGRFPAALV